MTLPTGIINAILTNLGAVLIFKLVQNIRFHSKHLEIHLTVISIFIMSYLNSAINIMIGFGQPLYVPWRFTPNWLIFYGKMIMTSMITSNLLPYAGPLLKILFRRGICCCRRKDYKPNTHLNEDFPFVRRYATILNTVFICFTYGFGIPLLFIVTFFILLI